MLLKQFKRYQIMQYAFYLFYGTIIQWHLKNMHFSKANSKQRALEVEGATSRYMNN